MAPFKAGDEVVFCPCSVPHSVATWDMTGGCCSCWNKSTTTTRYALFAPRSVGHSSSAPEPQTTPVQPTPVQRHSAPAPSRVINVQPHALSQPSTGCSVVGVALLIVVLIVAVASSLLTTPRSYPTRYATSPTAIGTAEAQSVETQRPFTTVEATAAATVEPTAATTVEATAEASAEATAEASATATAEVTEEATAEAVAAPTETPSSETPALVVQQIATARPALHQQPTNRPVRPRAPAPGTNATAAKDTPEPIPERATFVASSNEFSIDHWISSGSEAMVYLTLRPEQEAYFNAGDFELRLPGFVPITGRPEGAWHLSAGESAQRIVQFDIPPNTVLAGSTIRWSYHDRP